MNPLNEADPIWGDVPAEVYDWDYGGRKVRSDRTGGSFAVPMATLGAVRALSPLDKAKLTSWIFERNRYGSETWPVVSNAVLHDIRSRRPLSTDEKMDRLLEYLSTQGHRLGDRCEWLGSHPQTAETIAHRRRTLVWTEAADEKEISALRQLMHDEGYLTTSSNKLALSANGFRRMERLAGAGAATDQVFIAMWFSEDTYAAYSEGIAPAIIAAGYRPLRIDQKEHANKIDDEIISEIRRSRFLLADFTCGSISVDGEDIAVPRGGVYYEAGFAQGLGIPVIWTVRADQINEVHFDIRQYNQIVWSDPKELMNKLFNRIGAIFGHRNDAPGLPGTD